MQSLRSRLLVAMTLGLPALTGCLVHTRKVPKAVMPSHVLNATAEQLVGIINQQYDTIDSMSASVTFTATTGGALSGREKTYTSFSGYILLKKPEAMRVIGFLPVVHARAFDMASDGDTFKLWIPPKNKVIEGSNAITQPSKNVLENMRPYIFFDSLLIRQIGPDDLLSLTVDSDTELNPKTKKLEIQPEYLLAILRRKDHGNQLLAERVIQFSRVDLRPVEEDIYDQDGQIQTQALYGPMQTFGDHRFPGTITIRRPLEQYQIQINIQKLNENLHLTDESFHLEIPKGTTVQKLQ